MHGSRVMNEVAPGPRVAHEELHGEHVSLETIARCARGYDVAGYVRTSLGEWVDVIERGTRDVEWRGAVDAAAAAVAHGGQLDRALLLQHAEATYAAAAAAWCT